LLPICGRLFPLHGCSIQQQQQAATITYVFEVGEKKGGNFVPDK